MNKFYRLFILSRDLISFLSGIVVTGFVVGISLLSEKNFYHWLVITIGIIFSILSYILIQIIKKFEDHISVSTETDKIKREKAAWAGITRRDQPLNKVCRCFPQFWMPWISFLPVLFISGIILLKCANDVSIRESENQRIKSQNELIRKIDSSNIRNFNTYNKEIQLLRDSLTKSARELNYQKNKVDSLVNIIRIGKSNI